MVRKNNKAEQQLEELTADLLRTRADFENYRKMMESEKQRARDAGQTKAVVGLLPVIDTIQRAIGHIPAEIAENQWVKGVEGLEKQLSKFMTDFGLERIKAEVGTVFNPDFHEAVQFDEEAEGALEVIAEELQPGYLLHGQPLRHAMVRVTKK